MSENTTNGDIITLGLLQYSSHILGIEVGNLLEVAPIENLRPSLDQSAKSLGLVSIRGTLIPVVDPGDFFNALPRSEKPSVAAVVTDGSSVFCLGVDAVLGIRSVSASSVQKVNGRSMLQIEEEKPIYIVDIVGETVSGRISGSRLRQENSNRVAIDICKPFLTFAAGGVNFGIEVAHIFGTIPRRELDYNNNGEDYLLGLVHHLGKKIPVINTPEFFGVGEAIKSSKAEIVVLDPGDGRRVGLAVDRILRILYLPPSQFVKIEQSGFAGIEHFFAIWSDSNQHYFLADVSVLFSDKKFLEIVDLFEPGESDILSKNVGVDSQMSGSLVRERERQLIVCAGDRFSIPLDWVQRIIEFPSRLVATRLEKGGFLGYFFFRGRVVPLFCLARIIFKHAPNISGSSRILVVAWGVESVGLLVESVEDIAVSRWRCLEKSQDKLFNIIEVSQGGSRQILNVLRLEFLFESYFRGLRDTMSVNHVGAAQGVIS